MPRFVEYRGARMVEGWPEKIMAAQASRTILMGGVTFDRVRFGAERENWGADLHPCQDCRVIKSEYHVLGCDGEECPSCHEQLVSCDCETTET